MGRKLFCELNPLTYKISLEKERFKKNLVNTFSNLTFAKTKSQVLLPVVIKKHKSLIRRKLGNVDLHLQENKARSLSIATPKVSHILIKPGETFSFWYLVGRITRRKGYLEGVTISNGRPTADVGGGMCQFTNLLHWLILHTDLAIVEHHHHNGLDLFPDFKRQIPFGTGTSIVYNYLDYRFKNTTSKTYQLVVETTDEYLVGEIRATAPLAIKVHIREEEAYFYENAGNMMRHNKIYKKTIDKRTGNTISDELLLENHAKVMYDSALIDQTKIQVKKK
ncbi:hypothetical protein Hs30E_05550 [Lactococcus hodotermopsidis]|uniref:Vancomycin resistance protein n=1 Tax=Pseudolactococcus hodotermopsidis TaxID=2709157 RepID=A0A6A0BC67_9LACT|nr:VanW family protein [Lactococcus hodotermopsidis]GFH42004.1 hypothetical protein Hs30E_05550 [Lactococcus hodotermopsidis]